MATTQNYGWGTPTGDDYVKDTWLYMQNLADEIDASLYTINAGSAKVGSHLVTSQNFTNVSTLSINNCFSGTYNAYKIVISNLICASSAQTIFMRYRANGVDSSVNYYYAGFVAYTPGNVLAFAGGANQNQLTVATTSASYRTSSVIEVQNPFLAVSTGSQDTHQYWDGSNIYAFNINAVHLPATSYDGFTIYPNASTISGNIAVYGYRLS